MQLLLIEWLNHIVFLAFYNVFHYTSDNSLRENVGVQDDSAKWKNIDRLEFLISFLKFKTITFSPSSLQHDE